MKPPSWSRPVLTHAAGLLIMPQAGAASVIALIDAARVLLKIKMFTFDSPALLQAVLDAHRRGVAVQVMLNPRRSSGTQPNDSTMERLQQAGVSAQWTSPAFAVTHEKSMIADRHLLLATFNFVDKYLTETRDYGVLIDNAAVLGQAEACFDADWRREPYTLPAGSPLALSNWNAREVTAAFIDGARDTLRVQHPKYSDMAILDRLLAAQARGVRVQVLCGGRHGISPSDRVDTYSALRALGRAGVHIRRQHGLRLHAKLLLADGERGMLGSMNIDRSAYDLRRELGVVLTDQNVLHRLRQQFHQDWDDAKPYEAPDPLVPEEPLPAAGDGGSHDPVLLHE
jgi:cardiolipin synthase